MDRNRPFAKYLHETQERVEVPMHRHTNGQLNYVDKGTMKLLTPIASWVVPWQRIIWIPPGQLHSVTCEKLSGSWKIMTPKSYAQFLPREVSVLKSSSLLIAALDSLPAVNETISRVKLSALIEIIKLELQEAESESFGVTLPKSKQLKTLTTILLDTPEDSRRIDDWANTLGMSRRTFTRNFIAETGSSFGEWKKNLLLSKAVSLLTEGMNVSEIADHLGYSNPSAFILAFRKKYGASPLKFLQAK